MKYRNKPHFVIKENLQKSKNTGVYFSDVVTPDILRDVCGLITGQTEFTYQYVDNDYHDSFLDTSYNKGRMAIMQYKDVVSYISFSELEIMVETPVFKAFQLHLICIIAIHILVKPCIITF